MGPPENRNVSPKQGYRRCNRLATAKLSLSDIRLDYNASVSAKQELS